MIDYIPTKKVKKYQTLNLLIIMIIIINYYYIRQNNILFENNNCYYNHFINFDVHESF